MTLPTKEVRQTMTLAATNQWAVRLMLEAEAQRAGLGRDRPEESR